MDIRTTSIDITDNFITEPFFSFADFILDVAKLGDNYQYDIEEYDMIY